jgi:hypothetical protein
MKYLYSFLILLFFAGCEKAINIQPEEQKSLLVVDGSIENGQAPLIFLTTSLNYFSNISPQILASSVVTNAKVTLSDGTITSVLKPYTQMLGGGYNIVYYTNDSLSPATAIIGREGKSYTLSIDYNNNTYTSVTQIPVIAKKIDSLWWKPAPRNTDTTKVVLMVKVTDPVGYGNYIRYFTKVNREPFLPGVVSIFDDQIVDGTVYDIQVDAGINRNDPPKPDDYGYFKRGDTATIKFANIDKATYDFWRTLEFSYQSIGNPFSSPVKVMSNVSNGALGAFCGYGVQYKTVIIPK